MFNSQDSETIIDELIKELAPEGQKAAEFGKLYLDRYDKYNEDCPKVHMNIALSWIQANRDILKKAGEAHFWGMVNHQAKAIEILVNSGITLNDAPVTTSEKRQDQIGKKMMKWVHANAKIHDMNGMAMLHFVVGGLLPMAMTRLVEKGEVPKEMAAITLIVNVNKALNNEGASL